MTGIDRFVFAFPTPVSSGQNTSDLFFECLELSHLYFRKFWTPYVAFVCQQIDIEMRKMWQMDKTAVLAPTARLNCYAADLRPICQRSRRNIRVIFFWPVAGASEDAAEVEVAARRCDIFQSG